MSKKCSIGCRSSQEAKEVCHRENETSFDWEIRNASERIRQQDNVEHIPHFNKQR